MPDLRTWTDPFLSYPMLIAALVRDALSRGASHVEILYTEGEESGLPDVRIADNGRAPDTAEVEALVCGIPATIAAHELPHPLFGFLHHAQAVRVETDGRRVEFTRVQLEDITEGSILLWEPSKSDGVTHAVTLRSVGWVYEKGAEQERSSSRLCYDLSEILSPEETNRTHIFSECDERGLKAA